MEDDQPPGLVVGVAKIGCCVTVDLLRDRHLWLVHATQTAVQRKGFEVVKNEDHVTTVEEVLASTAPLLTRDEARLLVPVDVKTFAAAIERGEIPSIKIGRRVFIPRLPFFRLLGLLDDEGEDL